MAPTTKLRDTNFTDIGVAGRKTGITIKDTGQRDAFGMEHLDDFFNSPDKELTEPNSSPAKIGSNGGTISIDETMDIVTSELPARISSRASLPPRARSPIKTSLNSPARRASSVGLSSPAHIQAPINRKLTFGKSGTPSALESSPVLPPPLPSARSSSSVDPPPQSKNTTKPNGSMLNTDKPQQKPKNQPLTQVTEEPILISSPAEPLAKKAPAKRGLLVSKKPAGSKKAFSLDDTDSGSEGVGNVGREGSSVVLGEGGVVEGDTVMAEAQEAQEEVGEEEETLPKKWRATKQKPKPPPKKAAKATEKDPTPVKANSKAKGKKPVEPEPEQESEPEPAPPVKPARGKKAKAPEVEPETDPVPVKPTRVKKAPTKIPEPETELDPAPTKPTRRKKAAVKAPELETESDPARVKPTRGKKAAAKAPETETESDPALVKPTHGKKAKAVKETETESEPAPPVKPAKGKKAVSKVLETETESEPVPKAKPAPKGRGRKAAKPIVESSSSGEPEREPTPLPKPATKPRGKGRAKLAELEQEPEDRDDQEEPPKKRTKTTKEKSTTKPSAKPSAKAKGKAPTKPQKAKVLSPEPQSFTSKPQRTRSSPQKPTIVKKGGQRIIKQPPPPPRATSEEPGAVRRSTRAHIAPLAFWKGEKIMYGLTAQHESSGTIALPTITEVIRVESDSEAERENAEKRRKRPTTAGTKRKLTKFEEEDEDGLEEEEWESRVVDGEVGVVRGYVKTYGPLIKETPDEEEIEERELAFSRNRIVTVEVANGDFTFVKTCTEDFFGTGMVEIPPGGIKRTKNSGKMHLVFYVISGKVEVKIGDNEFRVRKGAQFMVPRGNLYSIENPYDFQAKMFFAQGCEKVITAEDRGDGEDDEEMKG